MSEFIIFSLTCTSVSVNFTRNISLKLRISSSTTSRIERREYCLAPPWRSDSRRSQHFLYLRFLSQSSSPRLCLYNSFFTSLFFNEYNLYLIKKDNSKNIEKNIQSLVYNETIFSVDNEYYLSPVINFEAGKGWKRSPALSNGDCFRRVPGYSLFYFAFVKPFGFAVGHKVLKYFQLLIFAVSAYFFYFIVYEISKQQFISITLALIYGITPLFSGWLYYTMTEAITPALMVFYLFSLIKAYQQTDGRIKSLCYIIA